MTYPGISIDGIDLQIIRSGDLTVHRYKDEILRPIVVPYATAIEDDFMLMNEKCRSHYAHLVNDFLFDLTHQLRASRLSDDIRCPLMGFQDICQGNCNANVRKVNQWLPVIYGASWTVKMWVS
ncbi:transposable element Tcb2 transposase [Trichonephila inaurata madagascariensis]|uniref:Transposable element Tcb2 transposase n=1 Tax=Trichonephila inaurata madagascariensis TaxID=2747483 RepID=A0A8X6I3F3_9ARAC|nr:transposable element Tcb2 transposase [Trichonephila inaurata madagascariensis]